MNETSSYKIETFSFRIMHCEREERALLHVLPKLLPLPEFIDRISSLQKVSSCLCLDFEIHKNGRSPVSRTFSYLKSSELHTAVVTIVAFDSASRISE
ncbi:hypothetical protein TNIN_42891 [Trichonephila inaurata madagascariensis]|uniref:Uncharacterized protein n=1 Tax=Trichonephila inaurata madagascariensis TaxID=2747483 RepID=A0A8X7C1S1_9ARAC|nr:hypothetical protein TNIN_42891 [Trichonephila inaurata madagascariensis]